jgi:hypothetical protein
MAAEEVYHGILCALIQVNQHPSERITQPTLHNAPLRIINQMCSCTFNLRKGGGQGSQESTGEAMSLRMLKTRGALCCAIIRPGGS